MFQAQLDLEVVKQPDDVTCGPTCLYSVYDYYKHTIGLQDVINEVSMLEEGGTLAPSLGIHALKSGFQATIYNFNLNIFDPTWFSLPRDELIGKLNTQASIRTSKRLIAASLIYAEYLRLGGNVAFEDLTPQLVSRFLQRGIPVITGLSATYLYRSPREIPETNKPDDMNGYPSGHFVVVTGIDMVTRQVAIADPYQPNPLGSRGSYKIDIERLVCAILLGVMTYDANLLIVTRKE
jgi:hypothetical protein